MALAVFVIGLAAASAVGIPLVAKHMRGHEGVHERKAGSIYYCPMHPTYASDRPGDCPICSMKLVRKEAKPEKAKKILYYRHPMGQPDTSPVPKKDAMGMDYVPVYEEAVMDRKSDVPGRAVVEIPSERQQLIGVRLGKVEKQPMRLSLRTVGRVAYDPDLYAAQHEYLSALDGLEKSGTGPYHEPPERARALVESAKVRLRLLGMSEQEIEDLERNKRVSRSLILPEASSEDAGRRERWVWIYAALYEPDLPLVRIGSHVNVRVPSDSAREYTGTVQALDPVLNEVTRSIRVRSRVRDDEGILKPGMYVDVYLATDLGAELAVSQEAVIFTGERSIVFVAKEDGFFEPREVKLGVKAGTLYEVKSGLVEGERVVTSGNFLIDSESRLHSALESMSGGEHKHG
jgi:hypothetical protein